MDELKIPITTPFDKKGSEDAKRAIDELDLKTKGATDATKAHSAAAKESSSTIDQLGRRGTATGDVIEGLTRASEGGVHGLMGLAKAAANAQEALKISGFNLVLGVVLGLGPALVALAQKMSAAGDATKDAGDRAKVALEAEKDALERLNQTKLDQLQARLAAISSEVKASLGLFEQLITAAQKIDDAKMAVELANVGADTSLSPEQKKARELEIRQRYGRAKDKRDDALADERVQSAKDEAGRKAGAADSEATALAATRQQLGALANAPAAIATEIQKLTSELAQLNARLVDLAQKPYSESVAEKRSIGIRRTEISDDLRALQAREELTKRDDIAADISNARLAIKAAEDRAKKAVEEAKKAADDAADLAAKREAEKVPNAIARGLNRRAERKEAGVPEPESAIDTSKRVVDPNKPLSSIFIGANAPKDYEAIARMILQPELNAQAQQMIAAGREAGKRMAEETKKAMQGAIEELEDSYAQEVGDLKAQVDRLKR